MLMRSGRLINLHTYESLKFFHNVKAGESPENTLPLIWDKLAEFSGFNERKKVVEEFNASNKWKNMSVSRKYMPDFSTGQYLNYGVAASEIEGAFVQGLGFFMLEEYLMNSDGLVVTDCTWNYKIPTVDTIPRQFNVEILNIGQHKNRFLSSKASGEPPLLLAASVHCAVRAAVKEARKQILTWNSNQQGIDPYFELPVPATMPVMKEFCGLDVVEKYLEWKIQQKKNI